MLELPLPEMSVFVLVVVVYVAAAVVGMRQLFAGGEKYKQLVTGLVSLAVVLEAVLLILRTVALKAIPLTGVFESMIVLSLVFGLIYLFFSLAIRQVWFSSVMVWAILAMVLLAGAVAEPAAELDAAVASPWAIVHAIAMILGGAALTLAAASAFLYLLGRRKLKRKEIMQVLGRVPNVERLERMNLFGVRAGFVLITIGLVTGLGLAFTKSLALEIGMAEWMADAKIVMIMVVWLLLAAVLAMRFALSLRPKTTARITIVSFVLILFAMVGTSVFCGSKHDFAGKDATLVELRE